MGVPLSAIDLINSGKHWSCKFFGKPEARIRFKNAKGRFSVSKTPGVKDNHRAGTTVKVVKALERTQDRLDRAEAFNLMFELESE